MDLSHRAHELLRQQKQEWELLRGGYEGLSRVQMRTFAFEGFEIKVQFNPGRITSSAAPVDPKSISERPCFLCRHNRPKEQRELDLGELHDDLVLLCNPFPIFPEHFTIPTLSHRPQRIADSFGLMLQLAREMRGRYSVFYNGPRCGASAPDHLHFQAGSAGFMPIDDEYPNLPKQPVLNRLGARVLAADSYLRHFIAIEGSDRSAVEGAFASVHGALRDITEDRDHEEPMMNVLASFGADIWRIIIFPRGRHRPSFYLAEGDAKMLLSPASVDLGGVCITPVERDFERITKDHIVQMFAEVTLARETFANLIEHLRARV